MKQTKTVKFLLLALVLLAACLLASCVGLNKGDVPYLQFSPDLEPISQELVDEINEKFFGYYFKYTYTLEDFYQEQGEDADIKFDVYHRVIRTYDLSSPYFGTIGDYVIFSISMFADLSSSTNIAGYDFESNTYVYNIEDQSFCKLWDAYDKGMLDDSDIKLIAKRRQEFIDYAKEHKDMPDRITEKAYYEYQQGEYTIIH